MQARHEGQTRGKCGSPQWAGSPAGSPAKTKDGPVKFAQDPPQPFAPPNASENHHRDAALNVCPFKLRATTGKYGKLLATFRYHIRRNPSSSSLLLSSLELNYTQVYTPYIRALLGTASHCFEVAVLQVRTPLYSYGIAYHIPLCGRGSYRAGFRGPGLRCSIFQVLRVYCPGLRVGG